VEEAEADLFATFHWRPSDTADMDLEELARWREKARQRFEPEDGH